MNAFQFFIPVRHRALFHSAALLVFQTLTLAADPVPREWSAQWLTAATPSAPNQWTCYRKTFTLDNIPQSAPARIACDSKYWLWINGAMVVFEGQLKRGPNRNDSYYDTIDLAPFLAKGKNTVAVLVWFWGKHGFSHNDSGKSGLVFDAEIGAAKLLSDATWKCRTHPAYETTGKPQPNFRLAEPNIRFDASKDIPEWTGISFDDHSWPAPSVAGPPPVRPWGVLHPRPIPQWRNTGLTAYKALAKKTLENGTTQWTCQLPYNAQVTPWFEIECTAGKEIDIRTDHYMGGGSPNVRAEYRTRDGLQSYESLGWMNGEKVVYTFPKGVEVRSVNYRETGYNAEWAGSFHCDDPALNTLWEKSARTLYVNMRDTFFDCPDRERAQWVGDGVIEFQQSYYLFDVENGPMLVRKAIHEVIDWRRADKVIYGPVPAGWPGDGVERTIPADQLNGAWDRELAMQMLAFASEPCLWNYYLYTGDKATMLKAYPVILEYLKLWEVDAQGLVKHRAGDWDWPDWGKNHDVMPLENAWYFSALSGLAKIARLADNHADLPWITGRMAAISSAYNSAYWRSDRYHDPVYKGETDDRANAMAVIAGLATKEQYPALRKLLLTQKHASPYMEKFVLDALCRMNAPQQAMDRAKDRWGPQIADSLTTLYEGWGVGSNGYGGGTTNHAWAGGMLTILSHSIAGIAPLEPGWSRFSLRPMPGLLKEIDAVVATPHGPISLQLRRQGAAISIEFEVPPNTEAVFEPCDDWSDALTSMVLDGHPVPIGKLTVNRGKHKLTAGLDESRLPANSQLMKP